IPVFVVSALFADVEPQARHYTKLWRHRSCSRLAGSAFRRLLCARMKRLSLTILSVLLPLSVLARGDGMFFGASATQTRLLLAAETAEPGDVVLAGVELKMAPRWHTYWRNGGDA